MITLSVSDNDIQFAKEQIRRFTATPQGKWRYEGVEAWRGIVCEMLTSDWLEQNFKVQLEVAKKNKSAASGDDIVIDRMDEIKTMFLSLNNRIDMKFDALKKRIENFEKTH